jgi:hypothetical protein
MAQVWVTFEEIQDLFTCDAAAARSRVIFNQWERRRCSDGLTRVLLPPELAHEFMLAHSRRHELCVKEGGDEFDAAMAALCRVLGGEPSRLAARSTETAYSKAS